MLGAVKLSGDVSFLNMLHHPKIEQNSTTHVTTVVRSRKSVDSVVLGKLFVTQDAGSELSSTIGGVRFTAIISLTAFDIMPTGGVSC